MLSLTRYTEFEHVTRNLLDEQCQYASQFVDGRNSHPFLGKGLRFVGDPRDYHDLMIHRDDVEEFVHRVKAYWLKQGIR